MRGRRNGPRELDAPRDPGITAAGAGRLLGALLVLVLLGSCQSPTGVDARRLPIDSLVEAPNFRINLFAIVPGAGALAAARDGQVYVATSRGEVVRLEDRDRDGIADQAARLDIALEPPVALAPADDGGVFAFGRERIVRVGADAAETVLPPDILPPPPAGDRRHGVRGPDGRIYLSVGPPCPGCPSRGLARAILVMRADGHELEIYARGVRRPGALDWHPETGGLAYTDQAPGRVAAERQVSGLFGLAERSIRPSGMAADLAAFEGGEWTERVPELKWTFAEGLAPHGMTFYGGDRFPSRFRNALLVALTPVEPGAGISQVVAVRFSGDGRPEGEEILLAGWRRPGGEVWGRPVDIEQLADGTVLISDDVAGVVYRLAYRP